MPNYTTSYSTKKKPRYRKGTPDRLPSARRPPRKGAQYLHRSQSFGGRGGGYGNHGYGRNSRKPYALIIVGCAFLFFVASIIWYMNRSVDITLNGEDAKVRINSTIEQLIADQGMELKPGNLLAVDDSVLEKGGGTRCTVKLDGRDVAEDKLAATELTGGEKLEIGDGADVYEEHDVEATDIQPHLKVNGTGAIAYVSQWGEAGRSEVWTGHVSGKTVDKGVVKQAVDAVVERTAITPDKKGEKYIALTFDEGPSTRTQDILDILKEKDVKATFFVSGDKVAQNEAAVRAIVDAGHDIGTNAMSDTNLTELSADDLRAQLTGSFEAVKQASGASTALVRPPFGEFSEQNWADAMDVVGAVVTWSVDSGDWLLPGAQQVVSNVVDAAGNGNIVLMTDNDATVDQTIEALPTLIDSLRENGFTIVPLSELIATDDDLESIGSLEKVSMPKGATLPQFDAEGAEGGETQPEA